MDLAKVFAKSSQFQVALSMGEIHVRPLTSSRIEALETLARSDQATDADVTRMVRPSCFSKSRHNRVLQNPSAKGGIN